MTDGEFEQYVVETFRLMDGAIRPRNWTFGAGYDMHAEAKSVAPLWLKEWDDQNRWMICFSRTENFFVLASAFGKTRQEMLRVFRLYYDQYGVGEDDE